MVDFLVNHGWVAWLALGLLFLIVEMFTLEFTALMLAVASLMGIPLGLTSLPFWVQIVIVALFSLVLILFLRPPLLRWLKRGSDRTKSNVDALEGLRGIVQTGISSDKIGTVKFTNGETWTARLLPSAFAGVLEPGSDVILISIDGATAVVSPV
ncbi:NfeD family protein [Klugiella xanthotipulae]|uniref:Membrane protein implicated in regulation of membrane protease activity n=1 Tax=Klugiella xanthotipulae TaxID=244735 RepID=A0A543HST3_9MICO|nr:NfeD family protein [Klugiella xanthotipulae]TQM61396.1 membrane protein implicated in regulation of membrane protease activity [Klugiella xanthotipulae]